MTLTARSTILNPASRCLADVLRNIVVCAMLGLLWLGAGTAHAAPTVWRSARASWYSPTDSGGPFACTGQSYNDWGILGVAHKTLPCGTKVRLLNPRTRRRVTVRVIDRGPYAGAREFDLTWATKKRIGFADVGRLLWRVVR